MSPPIVGLKMQTVGHAPTDVIQSIALSVWSIGSTPAMISPETAPLGMWAAQYSIESRKRRWPSTRCLARTDSGKPLRVEELETERHVIDAEIDEPVVSGEVLLRRELGADKQADVLLDRPQVRFGELNAAAPLETRVEVHEGHA